MTLRSSLVKKTVKKAVTTKKVVKKEKLATIEVEISNSELSVFFKNDADDFIMAADIEEVPGCCGMRTLTELQVENIEIKGRVTFKQIANELDKALRSFFVDYLTKSSYQRGLAVMVTTNDKAECAFWVSVLSECKFFKKTKVWKNRASNNIVTLWISA